MTFREYQHCSNQTGSLPLPHSKISTLRLHPIHLFKFLVAKKRSPLTPQVVTNDSLDDFNALKSLNWSHNRSSFWFPIPIGRLPPPAIFAISLLFGLRFDLHFWSQSIPSSMRPLAHLQHMLMIRLIRRLRSYQLPKIDLRDTFVDERVQMWKINQTACCCNGRSLVDSNWLTVYERPHAGVIEILFRRIPSRASLHRTDSGAIHNFSQLNGYSLQFTYSSKPRGRSAQLHKTKK